MNAQTPTPHPHRHTIHITPKAQAVPDCQHVLADEQVQWHNLHPSAPAHIQFAPPGPAGFHGKITLQPNDVLQPPLVFTSQDVGKAFKYVISVGGNVNDPTIIVDP